MILPRNAPADKPFWWYPLWAAPIPEVLIAGVLWLMYSGYLPAPGAGDTVSIHSPADPYFNLWVWSQCAFIAVVLSAIAAVFPTNTYIPEILFLGYTVVAFLVGLYYRVAGTGVEIGLGLIAYSGRVTLIAGLFLLLRRLLLQWRLGRVEQGRKI